MKRSTKVVVGLLAIAGGMLVVWTAFIGSVAARAVATGVSPTELASALANQPDPRMLDAATPCAERAALMAEWSFRRCSASPECAPTLNAGDTWQDHVPVFTRQMCPRTH